MIEDIKERFLKYIEDNSLINKDDGIVIGLSGGPDSVCLLHLLCSVKEELNLKLAAAHINHMIRGEEADGDEEYSRQLCEKFDVDFFALRKDVEGYAKEKGMSSETAGRKVRYDFFNEVLKKKGYSKIATAHNANDQAETILLRIMRGTGLDGLAGIPVKRENKYIRPILFMKREEVEEYCKKNNLEPRIDATNLEKLYSRNKVRLDIIPYMKENFNKDVVEAINRMALLLQDDNKFIVEEVNKVYKEYCIEKTDKVIIQKEVFNKNSAIIGRIIRKSIKKVNGNQYDVESKHIKEIENIQKVSTNKTVDLPYGIFAENVYGDIHIKLKKFIKSNKYDELVYEKELIDEETIEFNGYTFSFKVLNNIENIQFTKNNCIKYFNYDKINGNIIIRQRKNGDKMNPFGMKGNKKLKDIFIDMKVPKEERELIPVIQFGDDIAWLVSLKLSNKFRVTNDTRKILKIEFSRKEI